MRGTWLNNLLHKCPIKPSSTECRDPDLLGGSASRHLLTRLPLHHLASQVSRTSWTDPRIVMAERPPPPLLSGPMPSSFDGNQDFYNERPMQKVVRKLKEEPLIPLGTCLTIFAFVNAYRALRRGDSQGANRMFRARVAAQGFTVLSMVAGSMYYSKDREKTKELQKLKEEREAEEKRLKWIRELEVRDEEDKAIKAKLEQRRQKTQHISSAGTAPEKPATGGVLGKIAPWPREEDTALSDAAAVDSKVAESTSPRKQKSTSSLGAIGDVIASKKKEQGGSKPAAEGNAVAEVKSAANNKTERKET